MAVENITLLVGGAGDESVVSTVADAGWRVHEIDVEEGPSASGPRPAVGLVCIPDPDPGWLARVHRLVEHRQQTDWIAVVSRDSVTDPWVREFIALHCVDYHTTPLCPQRLRFALGHAAGMAALVAQNQGAVIAAEERHSFVGRSPALLRIRRDLKKIAPVDMPVLITGETGTGKELVARTVHHVSRRRDQPFVAVNCAAMPPSLIHAELFGFEKGAFTGAHQRRVGHLEAAGGGTIFLDEIGDLDAELQALLLRFLELKAVRRVGGREEMTVDARVVAATNVDLEAAVKSGRFREDLYYRLNVLRLRLPPLRERPEDVEVLAQVFLDQYAREQSSRVAGFSRAAIAAMCSHPWPGNVRELLNRVRRAAVMAEGRLITPEDLHLVGEGDTVGALNLEDAREEAERLTVHEALRRTGGNASRAARLVGVSRATLYRLLDKHKLVRVAVGEPSRK
ncbi:MAG TPA: sigma 54-interacting transcriptional regulator [Kofleriaceae bacterium]|nr:sigma 54-interacting transcriptional regulator [Kofleriaceae bacterium]